MPKPKGRHVPRSTGAPRPGEIARPRAGHSTRTEVACCADVIEHPPTDATGGVSPLVPATRRSTLPDRSAIGVTLLLKNVAALPRALYGIGEWAAQVRSQGTRASPIPNYHPSTMIASGRCLDRLFQQRCHLAGLGAGDACDSGVRRSTWTSCTTTPPRSPSTAPMPMPLRKKAGQGARGWPITCGHNKDHRPDLKQLLYILTVPGTARSLALPGASGNVVDDQTHCATWDLLCRLTGRRDFLYVADCKLATSENMAYIHQRQGRFVTVLPRTRAEDGAFRDLLCQGPGRLAAHAGEAERRRPGNRPLLRQRILPRTVEGYRLAWYHSLRKAESDARTRHRQVEKALKQLAALREKLRLPRTPLPPGSQGGRGGGGDPLQGPGAEAWIVTEVKAQTQETFHQDHRGRPEARRTT